MNGALAQAGAGIAHVGLRIKEVPDVAIDIDC
jgi:hypothetical protein